MQGTFVWHDLTTADPEAAAAFYHSLLGWERTAFPGAEPPYHVMLLQGSGIGGITGLSAGSPGWKGYIAVEDVDAAAAKVAELGGKAERAETMEGVGRMALATDRHGVRFVLFAPAPMESPPPRPDPCTPGMPAWNELHGGALDSDVAFYSGLFGWQKGEATDMGALGLYQQVTAGGVPIGGMMTKVPDMPVPTWLYYFRSAAADASAARVQELGGKVIFGPQEVPGGLWILQCLDPQGNLFGLVSPAR